MSTTIVTPEQELLNVINAFQKALLPAKLSPTRENGAILAVEMNRRGLPHTAANMVKIVNEVLFDENKLTWEIPPAKLAARKANSAIQNQGDAQRDQSAFAA